MPVLILWSSFDVYNSAADRHSPLGRSFSMDHQKSIFTCPVFNLTFRHDWAPAFMWTTKILNKNYPDWQLNYAGLSAALL